MPELARLSINQVTVLPQWTLRQAVEGLARHGVTAMSVWRDRLHETTLADAKLCIEDHGLEVSGLCFAGLISSPDPQAAGAALADVRRAIDEAAALGARCLVLLSGGLEGGEKDLVRVRGRALDRLSTLTDHARGCGVTIALEPLHPMSCATRSVLATLKLANDWCDALGAEDVFAIALDTYVCWWDPDLETQIKRAGSRIAAFHVSDWLTDTKDLRLDRGMIGDGVIDIPAIRRMVEAVGYQGRIEVEVLSTNWWKRDPDEVVSIIKERFATAV